MIPASRSFEDACSRCPRSAATARKSPGEGTASLPHGIVTVKAVKGGLDVPRRPDSKQRSRRDRIAAVVRATGCGCRILSLDHPLSASYSRRLRSRCVEKGSSNIKVGTPPALASGEGPNGLFRRGQFCGNEVPALDIRRRGHRFSTAARHHPRVSSRTRFPLPAPAAARSGGARPGAHDRDVCDKPLRGGQLGLSVDPLVQAP